MKGAAPIKAMPGADVESFGFSLETEGFCRGSFVALADDVEFRQRVKQLQTENDTAHYPISQWIVAVEYPRTMEQDR